MLNTMKTVELYSSKEECCACGACVAACPKNAISMKKDKYGFDYPQIDNTLCVNCGMCKRVCSFTVQGQGANITEHVYAGVLKDKKLLSKSTSGGIFAGIALEILKKGGVVYGAAWQEEFTVKHIGITKENELYRLQGSKYVQSEAYSSFSTVKKNLLDGKRVLFSGTPCQVSALKGFLGKDYENLFTIDIICHGVGNKQMFHDDLKYLSKKFKQPIKAVSFRSKKKGWGTSGELLLKNKKIDYDPIISPYYFYYLRADIFRDSCYKCRYPSEGRQGDITIGDYWKIESAHPGIKMNVTEGVSCILVNSEKGNDLFNGCMGSFSLIESDLQKVSERNRQLVEASKRSINSAVVFDEYKQYGYEGVVRYWIKDAKKSLLKLKINKLVPSTIKSSIKRRFFR